MTAPSTQPPIVIIAASDAVSTIAGQWVSRLPAGWRVESCGDATGCAAGAVSAARDEVVLYDAATIATGSMPHAALSEDGLPLPEAIAVGEVPEHFDGLVVGSDATVEEFVRTVRHAVRLLRLRRDLARLRGDLSTIARTVNHELRSPLGCITTSVEVLREEEAVAASDAVDLVDAIRDSTREALRIMDHISFVTGATASPAEIVPLPMGDLVWNVREQHALAIRDERAEVEVFDEWPAARGRPRSVSRIWQLLFSNALRFGGPEPRIVLGWRRNGEAVEYYVQDEGPGVSASQLHGLFRPFHSLHGSSKRHGLGLSIVHRLVELEGGACWYEAVEPRGARFVFTLGR
jgi:signal transduction histidine kinase